MLRVDVRVAEDVQLAARPAQLVLNLEAARRLGHLVHVRQRQLLPRQKVREGDDVGLRAVQR